MQGDMQDKANLEAQLRATQTTVSPNVRYPFAQLKGRNTFGSQEEAQLPEWDESMVDPSTLMFVDPDFDYARELEEFEPPARFENETREAHTQRAKDAFELHKGILDGKQENNRLAEAHNLRRIEASQEALAVANEEERTRLRENPDITEVGTPGAQGELEFGMNTTKEAVAAETAQAQAVADTRAKTTELFVEESQMVRDQIDEKAAMQQRQDEDLGALLEARDAATTAVRNMPNAEAGAFFKNMSGGQKFWAILGAIGGGLAGTSHSVDQLYELAARDYQMQLDKIQKGRDDLSEISTQIDATQGVFRDLQKSVNDTSVLKQEWMGLYGESIAMVLEAEIARTNVPRVKAEGKALLLQVRQKQDAIREQVGLEVATTARNNVKTEYLLKGEARRQKRADLKDVNASINKAKDRAPDLMAKAAGKESDVFLKTAETEAKLKKAAGEATYGAKGSIQQAQTLVAKVGPLVAISDLAAKFITEHEGKDIAGRGGADAYWKSEEGRATKAELMDIVEVLLRARTGAAASDKEQERAELAMFQGLGDDELIANLNRIVNTSSTFVKANLGALDDRARAHLMKGWEREKIDITVYNKTSESNESIAKRLGGRVPK
jgi:hypothetical protein